MGKKKEMRNDEGTKALNSSELVLDSEEQSPHAYLELSQSI